MTDAKVLADALVEAGMGSCDRPGADIECHVWRTPNHIGPAYPAEQFITDWRVAGKVLELLMQPKEPVFSMQNMRRGRRGRFIYFGVLPSPVSSNHDHYETEVDDSASLPRAIIEAWYAAHD